LVWLPRPSTAQATIHHRRDFA